MVSLSPSCGHNGVAVVLLWIDLLLVPHRSFLHQSQSEGKETRLDGIFFPGADASRTQLAAPASPPNRVWSNDARFLLAPLSGIPA